MKTRNYILLAATMIAAVLAGCQKKSAEPKANAEDAVEKTFYGSTTNSEKTTLASDFNTLWTTGDKIKVYANGGTGSDFTLTNGAGTSYGEFSGSTAATGPYVAVYPSTAAQSVSGTTATIELPATQSITAAETFADGTVPMVAYSTNDFLNFQNVGSLLCLKLKMKSGSTTLTQIILKGNNSEYLAGTATVNAFDPQPKAVISSGSTTLTVNCSNVTLKSDAYTNLYIFVPAGVFTKGFTATLYRNDDDLKAEITTSSNLTTEASKGQIFSADVEFQTTGYATTKDGTVKWIQLWKNGPKWAEYNVGATTVGDYGGYYCWGGTYKQGDGIVWQDDHNTGTGSLTGDTDTATKWWGGNWRMPSEAEFQALLDNCNVEWKTVSGKSGRLYTGKGEYSGNSVFFSAAGYCFKSDNSKGMISSAGSIGFYWSSTPSSSEYSDSARSLRFTSDAQKVGGYSRDGGRSVRAVLK